MTHIFKSAIFALALAVFMSGCSGEPDAAVSKVTIEALHITSFPETIDKNCRGGKAKIYDECSDQAKLFAQARGRAQAEGKIVLVSYGAEWCIWCHVFEAYIHGDVEKFTYTFGEAGDDARYTHTMRERAKRDVSQEAYDLKKYVSDNFVVAHIDYEHSPDGDDVLSQAGAWENFSGGVPYIFTVNETGTFAAEFDHDAAEVRRDTDDWYRGYDRAQLLKQLKAMHAAASGGVED
ncbi:MAG: hypothetical protein ABJN69_00775 [Hellea sp.]